MFLNVVMMHTVQACYTGVTHSPYTTRWSKTYILMAGGGSVVLASVPFILWSKVLLICSLLGRMGVVDPFTVYVAKDSPCSKHQNIYTVY